MGVMSPGGAQGAVPPGGEQDMLLRAATEEDAVARRQRAYFASALGAGLPTPQRTCLDFIGELYDT